MDKQKAKRLLNHPLIRHKVRHFKKNGGTIKFYVSDEFYGEYNRYNKTIMLNINVDWKMFLCIFEHEYRHYVQHKYGILQKYTSVVTYREYFQAKRNEIYADLYAYRLACKIKCKDKDIFTYYDENDLVVQCPLKIVEVL